MQKTWMKACQVWLYASSERPWSPHEINMAVPLSPAELAVKLDCLYHHRSQRSQTPFLGAQSGESWQQAENNNRATAQHYDRLGLAEYEAIESFRRQKESEIAAAVRSQVSVFNKTSGIRTTDVTDYTHKTRSVGRIRARHPLKRHFRTKRAGPTRRNPNASSVSSAQILVHLLASLSLEFPERLDSPNLPSSSLSKLSRNFTRNVPAPSVSRIVPPPIPRQYR